MAGSDTRRVAGTDDRLAVDAVEAHLLALDLATHLHLRVGSLDILELAKHGGDSSIES